MASKTRYKKSLEELQDHSLTEKLAQNEFVNELPIDEFLGDETLMESTKTSRRDFLKFLGFSTAAATLAACEAPIIKSVPYVVKPDEVTPGVPTYYASAMYDGYDYANVIIKTREGRPIKIEPNKNAPAFGTTNARVQASVLSLYSDNRLKFPIVGNKRATWNEVDAAVKSGLASAKNSGKRVVLITPSLPSPSTKKIIQNFNASNGAEQVVFDAVDYSPALDAAEEVYGKRVLPHYDLSNSELVVSFNADFLGDFNAGSLEKSYASARKPGKNMLRHVQVESNLSVTGANSDTRYPAKPSKTYKILADVYNGVSGGGASTPEGKAIVTELKNKGSKAVVLADGNKEAYVLSYLINQALGSNALTGKSVLLKESNGKKFDQLLSDMKAGRVGAVILYDVNPVYASAKGKEFEEALEKVPFSVGLVQSENESTSKLKVLAPSTHWLESWNDFTPVSGVYALQQPTIRPIFESKSLQDALMSWTGNVSSAASSAPTENSMVSDSTTIVEEIPVEFNPGQVKNYYEFLKTYWQSNVLPAAGKSFNEALYDGFVQTNGGETLQAVGGNAAQAVSKLSGIKEGPWEIQLYTKMGLGDGTQAHNPWLQELPDPITRTSWDNYLTMNPEDAKELGIKMWNGGNDRTARMSLNGDYYVVTVNGQSLQAPVFVQPGQARGTLGLALGYGTTGKIAQANDLAQIGVNAYPLYKDGNTTYVVDSLEKTTGTHEFANIQMMNTLMGRYEIARDATLEQFLNEDPEHWNEQPTMDTFEGKDTPVNKVDLWRSFDREKGLGPHFKLSIDLNSCTGCGACIVACQAENNVPVVGKEEIRRSRDMYWLRIDRYYADHMSEVQPDRYPYTQKEALEDKEYNEPQQYKVLVQPASENPDVIFQPMMCQHCNHAPCETVCPVAATSHGRQGQNMMAYNRCVGTRYCANNCPYKVRRFNWFNYAENDKFNFNMNNDLGRMVLNPDVVVRQRGVMEKCSMCIQMTQASILKAKMEQRKVKDSEFQTACANACPTDAIVFGDVNDDSSQVSKLEKDIRKYEVLEEVGTKPNVFYHVKIKNKNA